MKGIIIISFLLLVSLTSAKLQIQTSQQAVLTQQQGIQLSCTGANGAVDYQVASLPQGVTLTGNTLTISDSSRVQGGYFPVRIRAEDSTGQYDQRIIVIIINNSQSQINTSTSTTSTTATQTSSSSSAQASSSAAAQAAVPDAGIHDFLNTLDIPADFGATDYSQGYPTLQLPTGSVSNIPNYTPQQIAAGQAQPSAANRNTITAEDVRVQGTFQRQFNAAKALGNLLAIIKQATANKNVAKAQVESRTTKLNEALANQQNAAIAVQEADTNYKRAQAGVTALNQQATNLRDQIARDEAALKEKKLQRENTQVGIEKAQKVLDGANADLAGAKNQLAITAAQLADKEVECNGLQDELRKSKQELSNRPAEKQRLQDSIKSAQDKVNADQDLVNTLIQRLADARASLAASQAELNRISGNLANFVADTAKIEARVVDLTARSAACQAEYAKIMTELNRIKDTVIPNLEQRVFDIQGEINTLKDQLVTLDADIAALPGKIVDANAQLKSVLERLQYLRGQVLILQKVLREAYLAGNAAADAVTAARQNLDAAIARLDKEEKIIDEATLNLEKARIEKEEADLAVENILKEGADILPYAAAPSITGVTEADGRYGINGWSSFVNEAFGSSVKPLFTGDLQTLYPWKFQTAADGNLRQDGEQTCANSGLASISGYVLNTKDNVINMIDSNTGAVYQVNVLPCTLNLANQQNYTAQSGDIILAKGALSQNVLQATQTACVRR